MFGESYYINFQFIPWRVITWKQMVSKILVDVYIQYTSVACLFWLANNKKGKYQEQSVCPGLYHRFSYIKLSMWDWVVVNSNKNTSVANILLWLANNKISVNFVLSYTKDKLEFWPKLLRMRPARPVTNSSLSLVKSRFSRSWQPSLNSKFCILRLR